VGRSASIRGIPQARTALVNATVIDGLGGVLERAHVVVEGDRIADLVEGPWAGQADRVVDLAGHTLLPGLIDAHTHLVGGDVLAVQDYATSRRLNEPVAMNAFRSVESAGRTLRAGFTTVRDVGCREYLDVLLRDAIAQRQFPGPRIVACGLGLTPTGGHVYMRARQCDGADEVRKAVREHIREGVDAIKLIGVTGGQATPGSNPGMAQFRPEELEAAIDEAHHWGRHVCGHAHGVQGIRWAVEAGIDTIEHGQFLDDATAAVLAEKEVVFVPTLANDFNRRRLEATGALPEVHRNRTRELEAMGIRSPSAEERMAHCRKHGVVVAAGTDSGGNAIVLHGDNGAELVMLTQCGYSPMEAIMAATSVAARAIRMPQIGSVERGKMADLVAFERSPLDDITVVSALHGGRPTLVMKDGEIHVDAEAGRQTVAVAGTVEKG
jgi:imidazolonepropionase-like amidohydrolase